MGWIDIVFIVIIVLCAIIGLAKGLFESILSIFSSVLSVVVAILVSKHVAAFINKMVDANKFFSDLLIKWGWISEEGATIFGKVYTPEQIGNTCTIIISIIAVWILIKLAILLLSKLFDSATTSSSAISGLNRVLGLVFGAAKGFLIGCVGLGLAAILSLCGVNGVKDLMEKNKMSNFFYGYISEWVGTTLEDRIDDFLGKGETPSTEEPGNPDQGTDGGTGTDDQTPTEGTETGQEENATQVAGYLTLTLPNNQTVRVAC